MTKLVIDEYYVYSFEELSDKAKEKAHYDAIEFLYSFLELKETMEQFFTTKWGGTQKTFPDVGLAGEWEKLDYSIGNDRGDYVRYEHYLYVDDFELLIREGIISGHLYNLDEQVLKEYDEVWEFDGVRSREGTSYIVFDHDDVDDDYENKLIYLCECLDALVYDMFESLRIILSKEYENHLSMEYFKDLSECNEWLYTVDGKSIQQ